MITTRPILLSGLIALAMATAQPALAKVSEQQASKLKSELTPLGGERAGNVAGTIPEWNGGVTQPPANYQAGGRRVDPFANDKIQMTIDAGNFAEYADQLTDGQKALFEKYPDSFKMNIYPTRRSASAPDFVYNNTYQNALKSELAEGGNGVVNAYGGTPFPIPESGIEVIWNHLLRYVGQGTVKKYSTMIVNENGTMTRTGGTLWESYPYYNPEGSLDSFGGNLMQFLISYEEPVRRKGEVMLVVDPLNQLEKPRQAWQYIPGQRRVRRAPTIAYDAPNAATNGNSTYDDVFMFNGSPDRYDWTLIEKKEMYVPYNGYHFLNALGTAEDPKPILPPKHTNPEFERWELHRVWVVEATLKDGKRHIYGKRRMYVDEDSWHLLMADNYDGRGNLWRTNYTHLVNMYDMQAMVARAVVGHDLMSGSYTVNEYDRKPIVAEVKEQRFFTPQSVRKMARR